METGEGCRAGFVVRRARSDSGRLVDVNKKGKFHSTLILDLLGPPHIPNARALVIRALCKTSEITPRRMLRRFGGAVSLHRVDTLGRRGSKPLSEGLRPYDTHRINISSARRAGNKRGPGKSHCVVFSIALQFLFEFGASCCCGACEWL